MAQVILIARLIGTLIGHPLDTEWACWEDLWYTPRYVCEYHQDSPGLYASVFSNGDGDEIHIIVKTDTYE